MASIGLIALLNVISGVVALLISYYAYRNNRLVGSILLRYISIGFLLLAVGLVIQAGTEYFVSATALEAVRKRGLESLSFVVYTLIQIVAYGVFAWGYGLSAYLRKQAPSGAVLPATAAGTRLLAALAVGVAIYTLSQLIMIVLLLVIVIQGVRVFSHSKSNLALMVLFGFILIFGGHLLMLAGVLATTGQVFLVGNTIEFCGFVALLVFLVWSSRIVK